MSKIFKNTKQMLSVVVALAVIACSLFTGVGFNVAASAGTADAWDGTTASSFSGTGSGSSADPYIITTAEQLASVVLGKVETEGLYFKVDDSVTAFYMNGDPTKLDVNTSYEWNIGTKSFEGNFDGNGATVYALYSSAKYAALFPQVNGNVTIKNIAIKNAQFVSTTAGYAAGVIGHSKQLNATVALENCVVANNTITAQKANSTANGGDAGALIGYANKTKLTVSNCLVSGNTITSKSGNAAAMVGFSTYESSDNTVTDSVILGATPISASGKFVDDNVVYTDVYTDQAVTSTEITTVTATGADGKAAMAGLDWAGTWLATATAPELRVFHSLELTDNEDGTHSEACDCGVKGLGVTHTYTEGVCECGAEEVVGIKPGDPVEVPSFEYCIESGATVTVPAGETIFFEIGTNGASGTYDFVVEGTGNFDVAICGEGEPAPSYVAGTPVAAVDGKVETTITSYESTYGYACFSITNNTGEDVDYTCTVVYPLGTQGNPEGVTLAVGGTATVTVPAGTQYYVAATLPAVNTEYMMTVTGNTGFGLSTGMMPAWDTNGTITATVMGQMWTGGSANFSLINNTESEQTYTLALDNMPLGAVSNPDTLEVGETVTKDVAGEYWYTWTATEDGTLKLTMDNDLCANGWTYTFQNQNTDTVYQFSTYWDESDKNVAELEVNAGDVIMLAVSVEPYAQTAGTVVFSTELVIPEPEDTVCGGLASTYTDAINGTTFDQGDGTEGNPFIVETADQFAAVARGYVVTEGKYFKVKDGVKAFYMNGGETVANLTSAAAVKEYFTTNGGLVWWTPTSNSVSEYFKGNFDGNGVTVYGLYTGSTELGNPQGSAALFPKTGAGAVIKNITLKNSYIEGNVTGGIVATGYDTEDAGYKLVLENIAVINNVIKCNNTVAASFGGIVYAYTQNYAAEVTNCVVYGNDASYTNFTTTEMPVFSYSNASGLNKFYYIVSIGHSLQGNSWHTKAVDNGMYRWVYSDRIDENTHYSESEATKYNITVLEPEQMLGLDAKANMPLLDWENIWFANATCPVLRASHTFAITDNGNGTHSEACECGIAGGAVSHDYDLNDNGDGTHSGVCDCGNESAASEHVISLKNNGDDTHTEVCDCGYIGDTEEHVYNEKVCDCGAIEPKKVCGGLISEYSDPNNGKIFAQGDGTEGNPYIVETADQFAAVARGYVVTEGKYFKVKDGVKAFYMNGGETVANLTSADAVKEYFTTNGGSVWWEPTSNSASEYFKGNFDGNGVTIYGLYTGSTAKGYAQSRAALFPKVDGSVTIKNINLKNSYIEGSNYAAGIIAGSGSTAGLITLENCSVEDCYIISNRNSADHRSFGGVLLANTAQTLHAYNCIVVDNIATYAYDETELMPVISSSANSSTVGGNTVKSDVSNLIVIGSSVCGQGWSLFCISDGQFKNVYTDSDLADLKAKEARNTDATLETNNIKSVNKEALQGAAAVTTAATLDWENIWFANTTYPVFRAAHTLVGTDNGNGTHIETCVCGITGLAAKHVIDSNGDCTICDYEDPCKAGHETDDVPEEPATKTSTGTKAHQHCTVCGKNFIGGVEVSDAELIIPMIITTIRWEINTYDDDFIVHEDQPGDGSESNPYIIYDAEDLASVAAARVVNVLGAVRDNTTPIDTTGVYFKIADGIESIYMASDDATYGSPDQWDTIEKVKAALSNKAGVYKWWQDGLFKGHFDGNGATVYGLFADKENAGLFHKLGKDATIKNIAVKNSYFNASNGCAGAIAGQVQWRADIGTGTTTIENCVSQNNYFAGATSDMGALVGHSREDKIIVNNCLVADNGFAEGKEAYIVGNGWHGANVISNTIVVNGLAYGGNGALKKNEIFSNVYTNTDQSGSGYTYEANQITVLDLAQMQGADGKAAMNLDWANVWFANADLPELRVYHDFVCVNGEDGTHGESCKDCDLVGFAEKHTYVDEVCKCGATVPPPPAAGTSVGVPSFEYCIESGATVTVGSGETVFFEIGTGAIGTYDFIVEGTGKFDVAVCDEGTELPYAAGTPVAAVNGKVETTITSYESTYGYACFSITNYTGEDVDYTCTVVFPEGSQNNPEGITLAVGGTATVTVPAGAQYYVNATLPAVNTEYMMTVTGNTGFGFSTGMMPAWDTNGTITATVSATMFTGGAASFSLINNTDSEQTYTLALDNMPLGAQSNPDTLAVGETVTKDVAGEYWYTWTATEDGTLKLTMDNEACANGWTYNFQNQNTDTVYQFSTYWDESDKNVAELEVSAGDVIMLAVSVEPYAQTAGTVVFSTEFTVDDTVLPGDADGINGVNNQDLALLIQYLNDWDVEINLEAMDVDNSNGVNNQDLALLIQYLNDWEVELK